MDHTLKEEKKTDNKLTTLAKEINPQAHEEETSEPKAPRRAASTSGSAATQARMPWRRAKVAGELVMSDDTHLTQAKSGLVKRKEVFPVQVAHGERVPKKSSIRRFLGELGPGLITGASDDDPRGNATYSQVGAQFGYGLLWTMLLSYL